MIWHFYAMRHVWCLRPPLDIFRKAFAVTLWFKRIFLLLIIWCQSWRRANRLSSFFRRCRRKASSQIGCMIHALHQNEMNRAIIASMRRCWTGGFTQAPRPNTRPKLIKIDFSLWYRRSVSRWCSSRCYFCASASGFVIFVPWKIFSAVYLCQLLLGQSGLKIGVDFYLATSSSVLLFCILDVSR